MTNVSYACYGGLSGLTVAGVISLVKKPKAGAVIGILIIGTAAGLGIGYGIGKMKNKAAGGVQHVSTPHASADPGEPVTSK